jgi:LmbE family N-acetylglucosaminyl deacetylase
LLSRNPSSGKSSFASVIAMIGLLASASLQGAPNPTPAAAALPPFGPTTSLLVIAPHPDDEALCCAGMIQRVLNAGGHVSIVWITSGDGSELDRLVVQKSLFADPAKLRELGLKRMQESRDCAATLGVAPDHLFFLGYPDGGILRIITDNYITPYRSRLTDTATVPYSTALFPGHPYTGLSLEHDFDSLLDRVHPTLVLAPSPRDTHPDHRAAGVLTIRAMARRNQLTSVRYWIVHGGRLWPMPRGYEPNMELRPSPQSRGLSPAAFQLLPGEIQRKLLAVSAFHTQMEVMSSFLLSFVRTDELYSTIPMPEDVSDND